MPPKVNLRALPEMPDSRDAVPLPIGTVFRLVYVAGPSVPQTRKRARADTQESTNEPSRGRKDTQRPNDDARTSQARRQRNAGAKKAGTTRTAARHRKRQCMTFEAPDNDDDVPDSTNDTVAGHADDEGNERGVLHAASKPGVAKGSMRKGREIVEASEDNDGASGDNDGASGDNDGTSGDDDGASGNDDGASEDNNGASEDNEDNTTTPPPFTRHARTPGRLTKPALDARHRRDHPPISTTPTLIKKKVGWVEESESEELGGYGEEEGGRSEQSSSSVEVIAVQYSQPQAEAAGSQHKLQTKDKGKDKGKAKMPV
ncbi:hypothetical protein CPB84DRAFT_1856302 [Gymnopilus junonius]|uniref:Uncharacterized protein n=1 Tax=Gymnopilus junonius TaxID=109634 RepID=A0A9P5N7D4_GYMJU|nr:hypothetical protein CPB84DRAFT_1856302 [Gymnopilus junonius]